MKVGIESAEALALTESIDFFCVKTTVPATRHIYIILLKSESCSLQASSEMLLSEGWGEDSIPVLSWGNVFKSATPLMWHGCCSQNS